MRKSKNSLQNCKRDGGTKVFQLASNIKATHVFKRVCGQIAGKLVNKAGEICCDEKIIIGRPVSIMNMASKQNKKVGLQLILNTDW